MLWFDSSQGLFFEVTRAVLTIGLFPLLFTPTAFFAGGCGIDCRASLRWLPAVLKLPKCYTSFRVSLPSDEPYYSDLPVMGYLFSMCK